MTGACPYTALDAKKMLCAAGAKAKQKKGVMHRRGHREFAC